MKEITAYRLVDVFEELTGRELNFIIESWRFGDNWTAINQLYEAWLEDGIKFDGSSSITNFMILGLTQETHFEEGSSKWIDHQLVVDWKYIWSRLSSILEKNDSRAKDCQVHAVRGSRASCQRCQNDIYINEL